MLVRAIPHFFFAFLTLKTVTCQGGSLTFVIDDTMSMGNDIAQVRNEVDLIMDVVLNESSQFSNMVLVTFNDPAARLRTITNSREELKAALSAIRVGNNGNYDCPEMALTGVKLALESSLPGSYIYVFTDASAKDYRMSEEIKQLCQRKQSQVIIVLSGDCRQPQSKSSQVFHDIATACSGLVFRVEKNEVRDVLHTIRETINVNKTVLSSRNTPSHEYEDVPFVIDDQTEYAIVSASGTDVSLQIQGPSDNHLDLERIIWTKNVKVLKIKSPSSGNYVATVKSSSTTSVVVTGRSDFSFQHGFSEQEPKSFSDTAPQPSSVTTYLSFATTSQDSIRIQSAQILDMNENLITELPLKEVSPSFYTTESFTAPSAMFKVAVTGQTIATAQPVKRIASLPVTPPKAITDP